MEDHVNQIYGIINYYKVDTTTLDWMFDPPPNSQIEAPIPYKMVFGVGALGR